MSRLTRRSLSALGASLLCIATPPAIAQEPPPPQTYSARDEQARWINDPAFHAFYQATLDAFADGPDKLDSAAYEQRSREIFTAFAISHDMPVERVLDHLKAIPGEMIENVRRDPQTLASYDSFVEALFGPQSFPADAPRVGGEH
jgi:hypothetical protein